MVGLEIGSFSWIHNTFIFFFATTAWIDFPFPVFGKQRSYQILLSRLLVMFLHLQILGSEEKDQGFSMENTKGKPAKNIKFIANANL